LYDIWIYYSEGRSIVRRQLLDRSINGTLQVPMEASTLPQVGWTLLGLGLYFISLVFARWHHIARSVHAMIDRQLTAVWTRLHTEVGDSNPAAVQILRAKVEELQAEQRKARKWDLWEFWFWSRGRENAIWVAIHEVERQLAAFLAPPEYVESYLRWADAELRAIGKPAAVAIADAVHLSLQATPPADGAGKTAQEQARKALLGRAISVIYAERDTGFSTLMEWHNKASWLIMAALIIIVFLVGAAGHAVLFLAGAAGGYLSRVMRALKREDVPLDYGASWTTLFLSPLFGALAGWFGIALIHLAANSELNLLGSAFQHVSWNNPLGPATLSIAFLLGFSERFFDAVVGAVERHAESGAAGQRAALRAGMAPPVLPSQVAQPAPGGGTAASIPGSPKIDEVDRQPYAAAPEKEALLVKGSGFAAAAKVKVNEEERDTKVQSAHALLIPLSDEDVKRIDAGGDFRIVVVNPEGALSNSVDFV
jgi:hypothetical protein